MNDDYKIQNNLILIGSTKYKLLRELPEEIINLELENSTSLICEYIRSGYNCITFIPIVELSNCSEE